MLSTDQVRDFLKATKNDRLGALFALAVTAGPRPNEYLALRWPDLDEAGGTIRIIRTLERLVCGGWVFSDTKRPRSRRTIKLQTFVLQALKSHKLAQEKAKMDAGDRWTDNDLMFATRTGGPLDERNPAQQDFVRALKAAKLPEDFRLYDLRLTAAALALAAGVPAKVLSELLGHSSAAFTLDVYSHVLPHMQACSAAQVEALLMGPRRKK